MTEINKVLKHFKKSDSVIYALAKEFSELRETTSRSPNSYFQSICREIVGQQLSGKVANVIFARFLGLFPGKKCTPELILAMPEQKLRDVGMAWSKVNSIKDLAGKTASKEVNLRTLNKLTDSEVAEELMKVKGIGPWTSEMFLMFTLGRENVFSNNDLGLRKAITKHYKLRKEPTEKQIAALSKNWEPYRTYAALTLWNSIDSKN